MNRTDPPFFTDVGPVMKPQFPPVYLLKGCMPLLTTRLMPPLLPRFYRHKRSHQTCGQQRHTSYIPDSSAEAATTLLTTPPHQPSTTIHHGHFNPNPSDSVHILKNFPTILSPIIVSESDKTFFWIWIVMSERNENFSYPIPFTS